jgi:hypothetical protein
MTNIKIDKDKGKERKQLERYSPSSITKSGDRTQAWDVCPILQSINK